MGEYDDVGALSIGDATWADDVGDIGAPRRRRRRGMAMARLVPRVPGAPSVGLRLQPLGFAAVIFALGSGSLLSTTSRPQRPFKAKRLSIDIARTGATSTGLIAVTQLLIGSNNQLVNSQPIGAGTFSPLANDVNLELGSATTAIDITLQFSTTIVPSTTDSVVVQPTLLGMAIG